MKQVTAGLVVLLLSVGCLDCVAAKSLSADRFLEGLSLHPDDGKLQREGDEVSQDLVVASPPEVERVLPTLAQYTHPGNEIHVRVYATSFLLVIAMRPDGAELLSSKSQQISALLVDADPVIQRLAAAITDWVIAKPATNKQPYLSSLQAALQRPLTAQDAGVDMIGPLLTYGHNDPAALKSVLAFLQRDDLTPATRSDLVHGLGVLPGLPDEVSQYLVRRLDDPDPHVRASALVSYADATSEFYPIAFHTLGKERVERIANDPQEIPGIRQLAKDALAGKAHLSPNYDLPPLRYNPDGTLAKPTGP
jgi:hypothetical protein